VSDEAEISLYPVRYRYGVATSVGACVRNYANRPVRTSTVPTYALYGRRPDFKYLSAGDGAKQQPSVKGQQVVVVNFKPNEVLYVVGLSTDEISSNSFLN